MTEILVQVGAEEKNPPEVRVVEHPAWPVLKDAVERIRPWQSKDGSIDFEAEGAPARQEAEEAVRRVIGAVEELSPLLPYDAAYHTALVQDLRRWADGGFGVPDFLDSLAAFQPQQHRIDGIRHLVVFPMYTQNGSSNRFIEALIVEVIWPEFIAQLEAGDYVVYVKLEQRRMLNPSSDYTDWNVPPRTYPDIINVSGHPILPQSQINDGLRIAKQSGGLQGPDQQG